MPSKKPVMRLRTRNKSGIRARQLYDFTEQVHPGRLPLRRIKDTLLGAKYAQSSLLQIADACALIIRYSIEGRKNARTVLRDYEC